MFFFLSVIRSVIWSVIRSLMRSVIQSVIQSVIRSVIQSGPILVLSMPQTLKTSTKSHVNGSKVVHLRVHPGCWKWGTAKHSQTNPVGASQWSGAFVSKTKQWPHPMGQFFKKNASFLACSWGFSSYLVIYKVCRSLVRRFIVIETCLTYRKYLFQERRTKMQKEFHHLRKLLIVMFMKRYYLNFKCSKYSYIVLHLH